MIKLFVEVGKIKICCAELDINLNEKNSYGLPGLTNKLLPTCTKAFINEKIISQIALTNLYFSLKINFKNCKQYLNFGKML